MKRDLANEDLSNLPVSSVSTLEGWLRKLPDVQTGKVASLSPTCCPDAGVDLAYVVGSKVLVAVCHDCGKHFMAFVLGERRGDEQ